MRAAKAGQHVLVYRVMRVAGLQLGWLAACTYLCTPRMPPSVHAT